MGNNYDAVKRPAHYVDGRKYEPKDVIRDWGLNFNLGNAVKYLSRAGRKNDAVEDLMKAQEYIQFEIDALQEESQGEKYRSLCNTCYCSYPDCLSKAKVTRSKDSGNVVSCDSYINKADPKIQEEN